MASFLSDYRLFFRQFRENFHATGSVLPSGAPLGRALARFVGQAGRPARVLEVGPGTGAVTAQIVRRLGPSDTLDLVELNVKFVRRLEERFAREPHFHAVADRARIHHRSIADVDAERPYDIIISGLPLNNFSVESVESILATLSRLLGPGGTLSFFEYVAIRRAKSLVSSREERERLSGVGRLLDGLLGASEIKRDCVLRNVPPAWVHHVRIS